MNRTHRSIFNEITGTYVAVAETAKAKGKSASLSQPASQPASQPLYTNRLNAITKAILALFALTLSTHALSAPTGGNVVAGQANINQAGNTTTIKQSTQNAAIDWHSFNINQNETVNFQQPNTNAITLNRVISNETTAIHGAMNANGKVFILNPNGVLMGKDAKINVGGLVASTQSMSNDDFMAGKFKLTANGSTASVDNQGTITVPTGGTVALIAPVVKNTGTINASQGNVLLASAEAITITRNHNYQHNHLC